MTSYGRIGEFRPDEESITSYLERVDLYFAANAVADGKKVAVFLSIIGRDTYSVLRGLLAPDKPADKELAILTDTLKKHFEPSKIVIAERFRFHRRTQGSEESIADFVAGLRKLSIHCKFAGILDDALRDRFVCGLRSEQIQRKLLTQVELTFSQAVDMAKAMEAAKHDIKQFQDQGTSIQAIQSHPSQSRGGATPQMKPCSHCGRTNHLPSQCYLKDAVCRRCQKKGHIGKICRSTRSSHTKSRNMKWVHADEAISNSDSHSESSPEPPPDSRPPIFKVNARGSHPITVQMSINGKPLQMEVDTGGSSFCHFKCCKKPTIPRCTISTTIGCPTNIHRRGHGFARRNDSASLVQGPAANSRSNGGRWKWTKPFR